jgi:hypothetical protein
MGGRAGFSGPDAIVMDAAPRNVTAERETRGPLSRGWLAQQARTTRSRLRAFELVARDAIVEIRCVHRFGSGLAIPCSGDCADSHGPSTIRGDDDRRNEQSRSIFLESGARGGSWLSSLAWVSLVASACGRDGRGDGIHDIYPNGERQPQRIAFQHRPRALSAHTRAVQRLAIKHRSSGLRRSGRARTACSAARSSPQRRSRGTISTRLGIDDGQVRSERDPNRSPAERVTSPPLIRT